jgi:hypothetical protein
MILYYMFSIAKMRLSPEFKQIFVYVKVCVNALNSMHELDIIPYKSIVIFLLKKKSY